MHNLKDLRKNLENYQKIFKNRNLTFDLNEFIKVDNFNRELIQKKEQLEQEKKSLSKSKDASSFERSKLISAEINKISKKQIETQKKVDEITFNLPNIPHESVPVGKDEKNNMIIKNTRRF